MINDQACHILPQELKDYFLKNKSYIGNHSMDPDTILMDRWEYEERKKHFINLDQYGFYPFDMIPYSFKRAMKIYGKEMMDEHGILPWWIDVVLRKLSLSFRKGDWAGVKRDASYLGHYVADAFQPLHLTRNHDGQFTGNEGIHKRFEDLVEENLDEYKELLRLKKAFYLRHPLKFIFSNLRKSYLRIDAILKADREYRKFFLWNEEIYYSKMDIALRKLILRQLVKAIHCLGSLWYTAWVDADCPALPAN